MFAVEPIPADNPLLGLDNVVLTPHVTWYTVDTMRRYLAEAVDNCRRIRDGQDLGQRRQLGSLVPNRPVIREGNAACPLRSLLSTTTWPIRFGPWWRGWRRRTFCTRRWRPRSRTRRRTGRPPPSRACRACTLRSPLADKGSASSSSRSCWPSSATARCPARSSRRRSPAR